MGENVIHFIDTPLNYDSLNKYFPFSVRTSLTKFPKQNLLYTFKQIDAWCEEYLEGRFLISIDHGYFESNEDLILFILQWIN